MVSLLLLSVFVWAAGSQAVEQRCLWPAKRGKISAQTKSDSTNLHTVSPEVYFNGLSQEKEDKLT